jgi:hypothetical protein
MALIDANRKFVDDFFAATAPYEAAYQHIGFSYLAVKFGVLFAIVRGRLFLNTAPPPAQQQHFQSEHVRAGNSWRQLKSSLSLKRPGLEGHYSDIQKPRLHPAEAFDIG